MGLISFVKSAGEKLFGASEAKAATVDTLHKELEKHGLDTSGVKITVDGDKVHVTGSAPNTEQAEKIAIALGNTVGVQTVQNGTMQEILIGPAHENDGSFNLMGALRTSMATCGYKDLAEFNRAEVVVAPALQTEGKALQRDQQVGMGATNGKVAALVND